MNRGIPIGIGIVIVAVVAIMATGFPAQDNQGAEVTVVEQAPPVTQQGLKKMVGEWVDGQQKDDVLRQEIIETYYALEETGHEMSTDSEGMALMKQIRDNVIKDASEAEMDQAKVPEEIGTKQPSDTIILHIDSKLVDCVGVGPQKCMLTRENPDTEWEMFYETIDGFEYQEGTQYVIEVTVTKVDNPPADASSLRYTLVRVHSP